MLGTEKAFNYYKRLRDEVKEKVDAGKGLVPNEKFRLMWYGIPLWFNMGIFNYFDEVGGVFAYEPAYNPSPWPPQGSGDPLEELAIRSLYGGTSMSSMIKAMLEQCEEYSITGAVLAFLLTCRPVYLPALEIKRVLEKEMGIPSVMIECDLVDERSYPKHRSKPEWMRLASRLCLTWKQRRRLPNMNEIFAQYCNDRHGMARKYKEETGKKSIWLFLLLVT